MLAGARRPFGTGPAPLYGAPSMPLPPAGPNLARLVLLAIAAEGLLTLMDALIKQLSPRYATFEIAFCATPSA